VAYPTEVDAVQAAPAGNLGTTSPTHRQLHDQYRTALLSIKTKIDGLPSPANPRTVLTPEASGAAGDARMVTDAAITTGTATLTSVTAVFVAGDVGKGIWVAGAGAAGAQLSTTILSRTSATTVVLNTNAGTTVSGATMVTGTNNTAALTTWLGLASATTELRATPGAVYAHNGTITQTGKTNALVDFGGAEFWATIQTASAIKFKTFTGLEIRGGRFTVNPPPTSRGTTEDHYKLYFEAGTRLRGYGTHVAGSHAAGTLLLDIDDVEYHDPTNDNTRADGFHMTGGTSNARIYNPRSTGVSDDGVAIVSYVITDPNTLCHDIEVFGARTYYNDTLGRGLTVVGGRRIRFYDFEVLGSRQAGVYVACEGTFDTHTCSDILFSGGVVKNAVRDPAFDHGAVFVYNGRTGQVISNVTIEGVDVVDSGSAPTAFAGVRVGNDGGTSGTFSNIRLGTGNKPIRLTGTYWGSGTQFDTLAGITTSIELSSRTPNTWLVGFTSSVNPASIASNAAPVAVGTVAVTGAQLGDVVVGVTHDGTGATTTGLKWWGHVTATNTVTCYLQNNSASPVDVGTGQLNAVVVGI
jgi:hypothetical protein